MNSLKLVCMFFCLLPAISATANSPLKKYPITFLENKGQWQEEILFKGTSTTPVSFLKDGISFGQSCEEIHNPDGSESHPFIIWNLKFINPNKNVKITGVDGKASVYSYISGNNPDNWIIRPNEFSQLKYLSIYNNIDLIFYGVGNQLKYDYVIHKGGNPGAIKSIYQGVKKLSINKNGELEVETEYNIQLQKQPDAWQIINEKKVPVDVNYILLNDSTFGFEAANGFSHDFDLIIDPLFQMAWSSYTLIPGGSNNINYCYSNAMDLDGNVYLTGMVDGSFPITPGAYSGPGNVYPEVFVAKFSSDGSTLLYWTYLPGSSSEFGVGIAVDSLGRAYVTGTVDLNITGITNFPSTPNAYQPVHNTGADAFLTVLNSTGTGLVYSTFLGGTGSETGYDIALGANGIAYVVGSTSIGNFPIKASPTFPTGDRDVFVSKFDINQSGNNSLIYSTRIGSGPFSQTSGRSIAVNNAGNAFITGSIGTSFGTPTFPTTAGAYSTVYNPGQDGGMSYVTKLSATIPISLSYSTYLAPGLANGIALDKITDEAVIVGSTETFAFPITPGALQPVHAGAGGTDAYAIKLNAGGNSLVYSTFIGGPSWDNGTAVVINSVGEAYVTGMAETNFPTSTGSIQPNFAGGWKDFFVVHLNASGTGYGCGGSTYVGGSDADYTGSFVDYPAPQIAIIDNGGFNDSISISATTHSQDFPTTPGAYGQTKINGIHDQPVFFKMTCASTAVQPVANFNSTIVQSCDSAIVNFNDISTNNPTSWQWTFPGGVPNSSSAQSPQNIYFPNTGLFNVSLLVCNGAGCDSIIIPVQINAPQPIAVNIGNDTTLCIGTTVTLSANNNFTTYQWQLNGNNISSSPTIAVTQQGQYILTVSDSAGCNGTDTLLIFVNNPQVSLGNDTILCNGNTITLTAPSGFAYVWTLNSNNLNNSTSTNLSTQQGLYSVTITDTIGCSDSDSVFITVNNPTVSLGADVILCNNDSVLITATAGFSQYQWQFNSINFPTTGLSVFVSQPGTYSIIAFDSAGCIAQDTVLVSADFVTLSLINDTAFCFGNTITVNAPGGFSSYQWQLNNNTISNSNSLIVSQSGNYSLTVSNINGCTSADNVIVTVNPLPQITTTGSGTVCYGQSVTLTASGGTVYNWSPPSFLSSTNGATTICTPATDIDYIVTGTDANGCSNIAEVNILVNENPVAKFNYSVDYGCNGIELKAQNNSTSASGYQWSFGDGSFSQESHPVHYYTILQNASLQLIAFNGICADTASINNISFEAPRLNEIPNVFTPNGDLINDCFEIEGLEKFSSCFSIQIFNRWGNEVYKSNNASHCWKGKNLNDENLAAGVYFYVLSIVDKKFNGAIHIIR